MATTANRRRVTPIDERTPATVRVVIMARTSDPGAKPEDTREQVLQCHEFIKAIGWTCIHEDNLYRYAETKTGMRQVVRPVLRDVLLLAQQGKIDVIVCQTLARVDRVKRRRYAAIVQAENVGVEFRFAKLPSGINTCNGKLPDGVVDQMRLDFQDAFDQMEAQTITERLGPGKMRRYAEGLPHGGGRRGTLYGYAPGERRLGKHGRPMGLLTWVVDEQEAEHVRWLFDTADATDVRDLSLRGMARQLEVERHAATSTGEGHWSAKQVWNLLRNPKYAGLGRNLRFATTWGTFQNLETREVAADFEVTDRLRDPQRWATETYALAEGAIPPIVSTEQFERVQAKLNELKAQNNRGGPRRTDEAAHSSLLDGGYARCAHCGGKLKRYWDKRGKRPFYQCGKRSGTPLAECRPHQIDANKTDRLALWLLAKVLTDPQKILELADAAAERYTTAEAEAGLADAALAAYSQQIAALDAQAESLHAALRALASVPGVEVQVVGLREQLAKLADERAAVIADHTRAVPHRDYARERQEFLHKLFMERDEVVDFEAGRVWYEGDLYLNLGDTVSICQAAALLGTTEDKLLHSKLPTEPVWEHDDEETGEQRELIDVRVETRYVVYLLLKQTGRDEVRKLLRNLEAVVLVNRPRSRAEWATLGPTPIAERVRLSVLGTVEVHTDAANVNRFS